MTRFLLVVFVVLFLPAVSAAQTVRVLGGEHPDFTRLTFQIPASVTWDLNESDNGFTISLSRPVASFDLSKAFERIPRGRVLKIFPSTDKTSLEVALGCDCQIEMFQAGPSLLAVDLTGTPDGRGLLQVRVEKKKTPKPLERRLSFGVLPVLPEVMPELHIVSSGVIEQIPQFTEDSNIPSNEQTVDDEEYKNRLRVAEAEKQLLEQIGRAASQGLLKTTGSIPREKDRKAVDKNLPEELPIGRSDDKPASHDASKHVLMHTQNAMQTDSQQLERSFPETSVGGACIEDETLDVATWGSEEQSFGEQISSRRGELFGEFDRLNPEAARSLAKLYLYFGFGAEAAHTLSLTGPDTIKEDAILLSISRIMDNGSDSNPGPFIGQMSCDTNAALWAILAAPSVPRGVNFEEAAVLRAFAGLPLHLKFLLGPSLSAKLIEGGARETADKILRILGRGSEEKSSTVQMVEAGIHIDEGRLDEAADVLEAVVETNSELSPDALIKMIDADVARGHSIQSETVDLIASYVFEYQETEYVPELNRILIRARASAGQYETALNELSGIESLSGRIRLLAEIVENISKVPDEIEFLRLAMALPESTRSELPAPLGNIMSERLLDIGFPSAAAEYAKFAADGDDGRARRVIRAKIALAENRPRRAEADLLGLNGNDVDELRAEARSMTGDFKTAKTVFSAAGMSKEEMDAAWLAGDWQAARNSENEPIARAAELILLGREAQPGPEGVSLEANRRLLTDSEGARDTIRALLGEMEFSDAMAQAE